MLDKRRIRLMTKASVYECGQGKEDLRVSGYFKKDYAGFETLKTLLWITVGYAIAAGGILFVCSDSILKHVTMPRLVGLAAVILGLYLSLLVIYGICSYTFYSYRHTKARERVRKYYKWLVRIETLGEKGRKE